MFDITGAGRFVAFWKVHFLAEKWPLDWYVKGFTKNGNYYYTIT